MFIQVQKAFALGAIATLLLLSCTAGARGDAANTINAKNATGADPATIDLADDDWELTLLECLPGETQCAENLRRLTQSDRDPTGRTYQVSVPENLHQRFAWFHGRAVLRKNFPTTNATAVLPDAGLPAIPDPAVLIGGIGSVDTLRLNGVPVGSTGAAADPGDNRFASAWNTVRFYRLPSNLLRPNTDVNTIEIEFWGRQREGRTASRAGAAWQSWRTAIELSVVSPDLSRCPLRANGAAPVLACSIFSAASGNTIARTAFI